MSEQVTIDAARYAELLEREERAAKLAALLELQAEAQVVSTASSGASPRPDAPKRWEIQVATRRLREAFR